MCIHTCCGLPSPTRSLRWNLDWEPGACDHHHSQYTLLTNYDTTLFWNFSSGNNPHKTSPRDSVWGRLVVPFSVWLNHLNAVVPKCISCSVNMYKFQCRWVIWWVGLKGGMGNEEMRWRNENTCAELGRQDRQAGFIPSHLLVWTTRLFQLVGISSYLLNRVVECAVRRPGKEGHKTVGVGYGWEFQQWLDCHRSHGHQKLRVRAKGRKWQSAGTPHTCDFFYITSHTLGIAPPFRPTHNLTGCNFEFEGHVTVC